MSHSLIALNWVLNILVLSWSIGNVFVSVLLHSCYCLLLCRFTVTFAMQHKYDFLFVYSADISSTCWIYASAIVIKCWAVFGFTGWCLQCFRIYTAEIRKKENRDNMWGKMNALTGWSSAGSHRGTARSFAPVGAALRRTTHTASSSGCHSGPKDEIKVSNYIHTHDNSQFIIFLPSATSL